MLSTQGIKHLESPKRLSTHEVSKTMHLKSTNRISTQEILKRQALEKPSSKVLIG